MARVPNPTFTLDHGRGTKAYKHPRAKAEIRTYISRATKRTDTQNPILTVTGAGQARPNPTQTLKSQGEGGQGGEGLEAILRRGEKVHQFGWIADLAGQGGDWNDVLVVPDAEDSLR